jgi:hypothetical protein
MQTQIKDNVIMHLEYIGMEPSLRTTPQPN